MSQTYEYYVNLWLEGVSMQSGVDYGNPNSVKRYNKGSDLFRKAADAIGKHYPERVPEFAELMMNEDEKIRLVASRNRRPLLKFNEHIGTPRVYDLHIRICFLDLVSKFPGHRKDDMLFICRSCLSQCSGILAPMSRIDDNGLQTEFFVLSIQ